MFCYILISTIKQTLLKRKILIITCLICQTSKTPILNEKFTPKILINHKEAYICRNVIVIIYYENNSLHTRERFVQEPQISAISHTRVQRVNFKRVAHGTFPATAENKNVNAILLFFSDDPR